jgi:hypothetical protein
MKISNAASLCRLLYSRSGSSSYLCITIPGFHQGSFKGCFPGPLDRNSLQSREQRARCFNVAHTLLTITKYEHKVERKESEYLVLNSFHQEIFVIVTEEKSLGQHPPTAIHVTTLQISIYQRKGIDGGKERGRHLFFHFGVLQPSLRGKRLHAMNLHEKR